MDLTSTEDFIRNITITKCLVVRKPEGGWLHERTQVFAYIGEATFVFLCSYTIMLMLQALIYVGIYRRWWWWQQCTTNPPPPSAETNLQHNTPPHVVVYHKSPNADTKLDLESADAARILYAKLTDPRAGVPGQVSCCQNTNKKGGK